MPSDAVAGAGTAAGFLNIIFNPLVEQCAFAVNVAEIVEDLEENMKELNHKSRDIKMDVEEAERLHGLKRTEVVDGWLQNVQNMDAEVSSIKSNFDRRCKCFGKCSGSIYSSYKIGRKATRKLARVKDLHKKGGELGNLTRTVPSFPGQKMPGASNLHGAAVESNLQKVLDFIKSGCHGDKGARVVGIVGMGGVGKTSLLKRINNELASGMHFDHVIWVVVSRDSSLQKLQKIIAEKLKLPTQDDVASTNDAIFNFLDNKKFLLLLDDVWGRLDLDEVGIPDQRTVVFTTRSQDVLGLMGTKRNHVVKVECLSKEEAWALFKEKVGNDDIESNPGILNFATEISNRCKGLPLALVAIGRAMSAKITLEEWQHACSSLRKTQLPTLIPDAEESLFPLLKYSYDSLPSETSRQCLLLCAMFPENIYILKSSLVQLFWGHGLIKTDEFSDIKEIYDEGHSIIGMLRSACLLESTTNDELVTMHDIIREMAFWIARDCGKNKNRWIVQLQEFKEVNNWKSAERISLIHSDIETVPSPKEHCQNLVTLNLQSNHPLTLLPENFFRYLPRLTYLNLAWTGITVLPEEIATLGELQYLNLKGTRIKYASPTMGRLTKLRHLVLRQCPYLTHIPCGLISNLAQLQEFDVYQTDFDFTISDRKENVSEKDSREGCAVNLESRNDKESGEVGGTRLASDSATIEELKELKGKIKTLGLNMEVRNISVLQEFVDHSSISLLKVTGLEDFKTEKNVDISVLMNSSNSGEVLLPNDEQECYFKVLRSLTLSMIGNLTLTWKTVRPSSMFPCLRYLGIERCHSLRNLTWILDLPLLNYLYVANCNGLVQIIGDENEEVNRPPPSNIFPDIYEMALSDLPNLSSISNRAFDLPLLRYVHVHSCPNLRRLPFTFKSQIANKAELFSIMFDDSEWWERLELDDSVKSHLQPFLRFKRPPHCCRIKLNFN